MTTRINPITDLKSNLTPIQKKVLERGLVDKSMAELLEKWGNLPSGASELVNQDALKEATKETLVKLSEELAEEVEKEHILRETYLDLERIRWPVVVNVLRRPTPQEIEAGHMSRGETPLPKMVANGLPAVVDRMGRYYFRIQDVKEVWFVPGFVFERRLPNEGSSTVEHHVLETVLQKQVLYIGETPVCLQVTTEKEG